MKFRLIIDKNREEEVIVYTHKETKLTDELKRIAESDSKELVGYIEREAYKIMLNEVICFVSEDNNVYAITPENRLRIKFRLYQLEEMLDLNFIKINQSCIANINEIKKFDASISGTLRVVFKNGYTDYVSRRNIKTIKERLGII
ncbi:MAG: LytTR family transcriptional regulator DNA-binding domain-containing protein [Clostridia bacterium]|nr:LytTR family transcriptional regulator DNA-binding domain-containing protein [Clostridia bacterium]